MDLGLLVLAKDLVSIRVGGFHSRGTCSLYTIRGNAIRVLYLNSVNMGYFFWTTLYCDKLVCVLLGRRSFILLLLFGGQVLYLFVNEQEGSGFTLGDVYGGLVT